MKHTINVQMFGNFTMEYDGMPLNTDRMHKDGQFIRMMQVILHYSESGIAKNRLEEYVVGERDVDEPHTALRVIVYKTKKKLEQLGLAGQDWIYLKNGMYYWTKEIEVIEDTRIFEKKYKQAEALQSQDAEQKERKLQLYLEACYLYKGDFLHNYSGETWVAQEAKRYRQMFSDCVRNAAAIYRKQKNWRELEEIGRYAANTEPFHDWEVLVMEAMVELKRYEEAADYYSKVVDYYLVECGVYPSTKLMDMLDKYTNQMNHTFDILDNIQEKMSEEEMIKEEEKMGGYECSFPIFKGIYQMSYRLTDRVGDNIYLMLCTLVDDQGNLINTDKKTKELAATLKDSIRCSIRQSDAFTQYGNTQCLVLLTNVNADSCELIQNRINHCFMNRCKKYGIKYHVNSVKCEL